MKKEEGQKKKKKKKESTIYDFSCKLCVAKIDTYKRKETKTKIELS